MHHKCHTICIHYQDLLAMVKGGGDQEQVDIDTVHQLSRCLGSEPSVCIVGLVAA